MTPSNHGTVSAGPCRLSDIPAEILDVCWSCQPVVVAHSVASVVISFGILLPPALWLLVDLRSIPDFRALWPRLTF
eukprot:s5930_g4.t1